MVWLKKDEKKYDLWQEQTILIVTLLIFDAYSCLYSYIDPV